MIRKPTFSILVGSLGSLLMIACNGRSSGESGDGPGLTETGGSSTEEADTIGDAIHSTSSGDATSIPTTGGSDTTTEFGTSSSSDSSNEGTTSGPHVVVGDKGRYSQACAPDHSPAVEFSIGIADHDCASVFENGAPVFKIVLFQGVSLPVGEHKLDGGLGVASLDTGGGAVMSTVGSLTVTAEVAYGFVGTYDITFPADIHLVGDFDAVYCEQNVDCS